METMNFEVRPQIFNAKVYMLLDVNSHSTAGWGSLVIPRGS